MERLQWYTLAEFSTVESIPLVKCVGKIKNVDSKPNYFSFIITDGTNEVEATIYEDLKQYSTLDLPNRDQYVIVVGNVYKRELSSKCTIIKIKVKLYRTVSEKEAIKLFEKAEESLKKRQEAEVSSGSMAKTKRSLLKSLKLAINPLEIRSLILGCVYMTLENNQDLNSYTFSLYTLQKHRLTKSYVESKKLKQDSTEYLSEFIDPELKYLVELKIIEEKEVVQGQKIYVVYRQVFHKMEMRILGYINQKQKTGTVLGELVTAMNKEEGIVEQKNYIINDNFMQKILKKFIDESRIYKTSDKVLYPNS